MKRLQALLFLSLLAAAASGQPQFSQPHGLYDQSSLSVAISSPAGLDIRYTTDGSEPTPRSKRYTGPLTLTQTTILRAVEIASDSVSSPVATASYIFIHSVLSQSNTPEGYPDTWGRYTDMWGTAKADYEMDPEMTGDPVLRQKIAEGLKTLPLLSLVSDKENFFSHENDSVRGGIYIFTGPPVGDNTGHGWTRPASIELMGGPQGHDLSVGCGVRLHGGHGRLAEKNPKHSFRLVFKEKYGAKTLKYPLFGEDEPDKFDQLVLRCHFGNSWQHWSWGNNSKAQYTRDVWARRMQRKMGHTSVNGLYVHLFLNGMYWGLYNIAERVDDQFGKDHIGGKKSDIDVVKIEEDGGNHIEAAEGTLDAWNLMTETARKAGSSDEAYAQLDSLLDIGHFIDYMLINQYGGNTDWDHHNWYALRRRGTDSEGFRFLCWDSEIIFESPAENVLSKNNGREFPTGIFQSLLQNSQFARRYVRRAKEVLCTDGLLGEASVREVWDSLYHTIHAALYDEAARWGDYRRDVHRYNSHDGYQLCTVDGTYQTERNRLLTQYFPVRSDNVLGYILNYVDIDDFEAPENWEKLTASMFREWTDGSGNAQPLDKQVAVDWNFGYSAGGGTALAGFVNVNHNQYADLSGYESLVLRGTGGNVRILANRIVSHGPWKELNVSFNAYSPYWDAGLGVLIVPLDDLKTAPTSEGVNRYDDFVHLNALKVDWNNTVNLKAAYLIPKAEQNHIMAVRNVNSRQDCYNLNGQRIQADLQAGGARLAPGIYIQNGKKYIVR